MKHGANPNHSMPSGFTPVYVAATNNHAVCLEMLLQAGGSANKAMLTDRATPAHVAAENGMHSEKECGCYGVWYGIH